MSEADDDKPKAGLLSRWRRRGEAPAAPEAGEAARRGWLAKLAAGLSRTSSTLGRGVADIFAKRKLDADALDELEDILIQADLGLAVATRIREAVGARALRQGDRPGGGEGDPRRGNCARRSSRWRGR